MSNFLIKRPQTIFNLFSSISKLNGVGEKRFTVLPGIVETDHYHHINFPTIWHSTKDVVIDRGTPFIQVIPFKRDDWDFKVDQMTQKDIDLDRVEKSELNSKFKNSYRAITQRFKKDR